MNLPIIPIRLQGGLSLVLDVGRELLVGLVFISLSTGSSKVYVLALLQSTLLGYRTKIGLLLVMAFVLGVGLWLIGYLLITNAPLLIYRFKKGRSLIDGYLRPDAANAEIMHAAFDRLAKRSGVILPPPGSQHSEGYANRQFALVGTLVMYYANLYEDLGAQYRFAVARAQVVVGMCGAFLCAAILPQQPLRIPLLVGAAAFWICGFYLLRRGILSYGYLITVGYFRETKEDVTAALNK
jgi:hypothetical protein